MNLSEFPIVRTFSYAEYIAFCESLVDQQLNSGPTQTEALANFTKLNLSRMKRVQKTLSIPAETLNGFKEISQGRWIVITESWCGDAAQSVPVIAHLAELNSNIQCDIVLRDENPELIDAFLTNGGRSIPKVLFINPDGEIVQVWGPRPQVLQEAFVAEHKAGIPHEQSVLMLQDWYNNDKGATLAQEILALIG